MSELPRTPTPLTMPEVARELAAAHYSVVNILPHANVLAIACAIIGLENARGKAILNHNYGNISWVGQTTDWWTHPKPQEGQPLRFAAYPSHQDGARAWWKLMRRRYLPVLARGLAADPRGAVRELYRLGYVAPASPGEEDRYAKAVVSMYREAADDWIPASGVYSDPMGPIALGLGLATVLGPWLERWFA